MLCILIAVERFGRGLKVIPAFPCETLRGGQWQVNVQKFVVYFQSGFADRFERAVVDGYDQPVFGKDMFARLKGGRVEDAR